VIGRQAQVLYRTVTTVHEATFDRPNGQESTRHLALASRSNPAGRDECCIFYDGNIHGPVGSDAEMLRFFSTGTPAHRKAAQAYFTQLVKQLGFYRMPIAHNVRPVGGTDKDP
jgi:hypothetical protein